MGGIYDEHGNYQGSIDREGHVSSSTGTYLGTIGSDGRMYDDRGNYLGSVWENGYVYSDSGIYLGHIYENGEFYSADGSYRGRIYNAEFLKRNSGYQSQERQQNTNYEAKQSMTERNNGSSSIPTGGGDGGCLGIIIGAVLILFAGIFVLAFCYAMVVSAVKLFFSPAALLFVSISVLSTAIGQFFPKKDGKSVSSRWKQLWLYNLGFFVLWIIFVTIVDQSGSVEDILISIAVFIIIGALIAVMMTIISYLIDELIKNKLQDKKKYKQIFLGVSVAVTIAIMIVLQISGVLEKALGQNEKKHNHSTESEYSYPEDDSIENDDVSDETSDYYVDEDTEKEPDTEKEEWKTAGNAVVGSHIGDMNDYEWLDGDYIYSVDEVETGDSGYLGMSVQRHNIKTDEEEIIYEDTMEYARWDYKYFGNTLCYYENHWDEETYYLYELDLDNGEIIGEIECGMEETVATEYYLNENGIYQLIMEDGEDAVLYLYKDQECTELLRISKTDIFYNYNEGLYFSATFYDHNLYYFDQDNSIVKVSLDNLEKEKILSPDSFRQKSDAIPGILSVHEDCIVYQCCYDTEDIYVCELHCYNPETQIDNNLGAECKELNYSNGNLFAYDNSGEGESTLYKFNLETEEMTVLGVISGLNPIMNIYDDSLVLMYDTFDDNGDGGKNIVLNLNPDDYEYNQDEIDSAER